MCGRWRATWPADWIELPALAVTPTGRSSAGVRWSRHGYGDPSAGCYALVQEAEVDGAITATALDDALAQLLSGVAPLAD